MENLEVLKAKRKIVKSSATKLMNNINDIFLNSESTIELNWLEETLAQINDKENQFQELCKSIEAEIKDMKQLESELEASQEYREKFISVKCKLMRKLKEFQRPQENNLISDLSVALSNIKATSNLPLISQNKIRVNLPKLNIEKFDGNSENWQEFYSQFKSAIHDNEDLNNIDKFTYLKNLLKGSAQIAIQGLTISDENYALAIKILEDRYNKKELLIRSHINKLLNLPPVRSSSNLKELRNLYDTCEIHIRSLKSLGIELQSYGNLLFPIITKLIPDDLMLNYNRENKDETESWNVSKLLEFLKDEVETRERTLSFRRKEFEEKSYKDKYKKPTAAGLFTSRTFTCLFCGKPHESKDCVSARSLSLEEKRNKVREKNCCLKCLRYGHRAKLCRVFVRCNLCSKPHTELFCPETNKKKESSEKSKTPELVQNTHANQQCLREVALMTLMVVIKGNKKSKRVRALLDSGSQKSYILKSTAEELNLRPLGTEVIAHTVFGGAQIDAKPHNKYKVDISAADYNNRNSDHMIDFLDHEKICGRISRIPKELVSKELKRNRLWISDIGSGCPEIEILIGSDFYGQLLTGRVKQLDNGFTAIQTKLGWTICGQSGLPSQGYVNSGTAVLMTNLYLKEFSVPDLWKLETIGINDPAQTLSRKEEEEMAHDMFLKRLSRNKDGRYCVGLPWTCNNSNIPSNRNEAERRLFSTTRKLKKLNKFEDYDSVLKEWQKEGVIEEVNKNELTEIKGHYLCHHPVLKPDSTTTSIRPVFDASCKVGRSPSLNDCLFKGPNLIEEIPAILLRFREKAIAVVSDIRRAFLQIEVKKEDRHFLRFLWWENPEEIKVYQHNRVVFGVTSSPFLLSAVIRYHLNQYPENLKPIAQKLLRSFYVDNCVTSVDNTSELEEFITKSTEIMSDAKMDLRLWQFGPIDNIEKSSFDYKDLLDEDLTIPVSVLGIKWDRTDDSLMISNKFDSEIEKLSKRKILSITQGIYDPIGFLAPALLPAKLIIQKAWSTKAEWDSPLPEKMQKDFKKWYSELKHLSEFKINRRIGYGAKENWSIHVFCDSSQSAYATVIFLRCRDTNEILIQFLGAKSRLAPKKSITIPRLELLACVLGARLANYIIQALDIRTVPVYYWTDSTTVLAWIQRNDQWGTFVGNRIKEICKLTDPHQWHLVPGNQNPADLPSRGCSPKQLIETGWWEGPKWLKNEENSWPQMKNMPNEDFVMSERKKTAVSLLTSSKVDIFMNYERVSKFCRFINIICWIKRFVKRCKNKNHVFPSQLSAEEKEEAEKFLWSRIQLESFGDVTETVKGLIIIKDQDNIIRVKTKLLDREDNFSFKYPILLPSKHHVVKCLIRHCHLKNCHAGLQTVGSILRENYWIISAKRNIRSEISKCVRCKIFSSKPFVTPTIQLPFDRVRDSKVFEVVGIDLCGPLFLKNKSKVWIVIFTCAVYRAIHLELVTNLSTEGFIQALRRFIARRGRISTIYSDNGTNFRGTNNLLKSLNWNEIQNSKDLAPIKWKFIPPTAAWWGGWWERLIRSVKNLLLRTLGRTSLKFEDLSTILCEVEATMNNRPLTYIAEESDKFVPLTPSSFIQDIQEIGVPDLEAISSQKLRKRYRECQSIKEQLRNRFRKEYLASLVQRSKEKSQAIQTNDIVLVELNNKKRLEWPLGRVIKLFPSRDGCARVAEVKTSSGTLVRPIRRLYPLELSNRDDPVIQILNFSKNAKNHKTV